MFQGIPAMMVSGGIPGAAPPASGYTKKRTVTVDNILVPSTQTDFAVLISATDAGLKTTGNGGSVTSANGYDIRVFSDSALTSALTYQLESYDGAAGTLVMWVKISSLDSASDTIFYLAYGNASLTTDGSSTATWDSNYLSIWHMADNAASTTILKATSTGSDATNNVNTSTVTATGQIGRGLSFNGTTDGAAAPINFTTNHTITVSFWMNWTTNGTNDDLAFEFPNNFNSKNGFIVDWNAGAGMQFGSSENTGNHYWSDHFTRPSQATWHLVHLVMCRDVVTPFNKGYVDGTLQTLTADTHTFNPGDTQTDYDNTGSLYFMSRGAASLNGAGILDEVRLSTIERSQDWITTEYNNQSNPGVFAVLGTEGPG